MNKEEIRKNYPPRRVESQREFDTFMELLNAEQREFNHPYLDRLREINKQRTLIRTQMTALQQQLNALKVEAIDIEQKQKDMNRAYHGIKHEMIVLNPKDAQTTVQNTDEK